VPAGGGNFDGAFDMLLTFDLTEIKIRFSRAQLTQVRQFAQFALRHFLQGARFAAPSSER
jgi:hypothetical protein